MPIADLVLGLRLCTVCSHKLTVMLELKSKQVGGGEGGGEVVIMWCADVHIESICVLELVADFLAVCQIEYKL